MEDRVFGIAVRRRLLMKGARLLGVPSVVTQCPNRAKNGTVCGATVEADMRHALTCQSGGGRNTRHNAVRDFLARWVQERVDSTVLTEQIVSQWARKHGELVEQAQLDVTWNQPGRKHCIDVVLVAPDDGSEAVERVRADRPGLAAKRAEEAKHRRYPTAHGTPRLTPFAIEHMGRVGDEARTWLRELVRRTDEDPHGSVDSVAFWQGLSAVVQSACVEQLLVMCAPCDGAAQMGAPCGGAAQT